MKTQLIQADGMEEKKQTINKSIRICVNCGSISVKIQNYGIFCKECGVFFNVKEDNKWAIIHVEVYADTMTQIRLLEILKFRFSENTAQPVI